MGHAYTPGLKVTKKILIRKERRLPLQGEVLVAVSQKVKAEDIVARTELPGKVSMVNVVNALAIMPEEIEGVMKKKEGDSVEKGEVIAESSSFFGLFKSTCCAPVSGTIENISNVTGQVVLREPPLKVEVHAYIDGEVEEVIEKEGVIIRTWATFIQGIFGIGGEVTGNIKMVAQSPDQILKPEDIDDSCSGKILVGGSLVTNSVIREAIRVKALGIIAGGINDQELKDFLGYDLGVAITGSENKGITLVITEGFGAIRMAEKTFQLLQESDGMKASINGATQIRAGVIRPEVIIPISETETKDEEKADESGLKIGCPVRIIREPYFGYLAKVTALPVELFQLETESKARVLEVETESGERLTIPRANVELIEI